ncbi:hypothetical protein RSOLAG1IB_12097 [Rhizoctonia solani AG-1 IB]|uniref:Uncharacterized protein n=1 Tax=Thanatephorus cucumeris (strain AG1-IB / isolate 7/3/14) TaxID=1108050 RepID=A0A0B7FM26_THACB|nr:hypothetical protein RSOLAG1IB_12097 [Rhizoctonia solani AG-1 IB]
MIGLKHPGIFGQPAKAAWGEIWDSIGPASDVVRSGQAVYKTDDQMFFNSLTELHLPEEVYQYVHLPSPVYVPTTFLVHGTGRPFGTKMGQLMEFGTLRGRQLQKSSPKGGSVACPNYSPSLQTQEPRNNLENERWRYWLEILATLYWCQVENPPSPDDNNKGAPLAIKYLRHRTSSLIHVKLTLAGSVGIPSNHPMAKETIDYTLDPVTYHVVRERSDSMSTVSSPMSIGPTGRPPITSTPNSSASSIMSSAGLDMANALVSGSIELVDPLPSHLAKDLDERGFGDVPRTAAILPISTSTSSFSLPHAVLVVGLNTRRTYDADYASWLESLSAGISNQLSVVLQREADTRMMMEREKMDKAKTMFFTNVSHGGFLFATFCSESE